MYRALACLGFVSVLSAPVYAQQDTSAQLLQEVRLLRQALESLVSTGARVQIVFGRLQLQEQRTATAVRRLDDMREAHARQARETTELVNRISAIEESLRESRGTAAERAPFEEELQHTRRAAASMETERQRLQNEEAMAAAALASEQARWAELNQQLEDLERTLAKKSQ